MTGMRHIPRDGAGTENDSSANIAAFSDQVLTSPRGAPAEIPCRHCGVVYTGTARALKRLRSEGRGGYCSDICKRAAIEARRVKTPTYGPCPTCGAGFASKYPKTYCSMKCYTASPAFAATALAASKKALEVQGLEPGSMVPCLECGTPAFSKASQNRKFCSSGCYRNYQAKRFDRWVANPEGISVEQSFDEFLMQDELECLIKGCGWAGHSLSAHMNFAHGVPKAEFKRAAGFNLTTGVVSAPFREELRLKRAGYGNPDIAQLAPANPNRSGYASKEAAEHRAKARALYEYSHSPRTGDCPQCGAAFSKPALGHKKYCSEPCRTAAAAMRRKGGGR